MKKIAVYVPENAVIEAITPAYRLFRTANEFLMANNKKTLFEVEYVGLKNEIAANDGEYVVKVNRHINEVNNTDLIIIPAIYGDVETAIRANAGAYAWIREMYGNGSEIASLCLGAFLLGETGLADGKKCSTHWAYGDLFRSRFPAIDLADSSVITDEGGIYSSGGANSLWNLLLYLLEKYTDRNTAILAAKYFAIDIDRQSQAAFTIFTGQKDHHDSEIRQAQEYIEANFVEKITVDELAARAIVSRRSFERRFKQTTNNTPVEYLQRVRIEAAKRSFEASRKNVTEVMFDVGYTDMKAFREVFKKITGLTPIEYRNKYSKLELEVFE